MEIISMYMRKTNNIPDSYAIETPAEHKEENHIREEHLKFHRHQLEHHHGSHHPPRNLYRFIFELIIYYKNYNI